MATNYYNRNKQQLLNAPRGGAPMPPAQSNAGDGTSDIPPVQTRAPMPTGDEPVDAGAGYGGNVPEQSGQGPAAAVDVSQPDQTQDITQLLQNGSLARSPYYNQILENQKKLIALRAMPTYVNKQGQTVQGLQDQDGRLQSGLKAVVGNLAHMNDRPVRNWGDFGAGLAGAAGAGIAGSVFPEWNEWKDRNTEIAKLQKENAEMIKESGAMSTMQGREINQNLAAGRLTVQQQQLQERKARNAVQNLNEQQNMALKPIMERGYYYEGDNPAEDQQLAGLHIVMPDFDNKHKPMNVNGQAMTWDVGTRQYVPAQGAPVDPDEQPMTFEVDGKPVTASTKWYLQYQGAKERQQSQQNFQAGEQQKRFEHEDKINAANKQMTESQLTERLTKYASDNFVTLEQAKDAFRKAGVDVDGILRRK